MAGQYERPKGFVPWRPQYKTQVVLDQVQDILAQYSEYGAMTCRQIFYRLVGQYNYEKTEKAYNRLCEYLVRARRAQMIHFNQIRDDGGFSRSPTGFDTPEEWWEDLEEMWRSYTRRRDDGQAFVLELWCEAEGVAPMLASAVNQYGVATYATGGFSSVTVTRQIAQRAAKRDLPTIFLHVGDYDPSGESIFEAMSEDARKFFYQSKHWEGDNKEDLTFEAIRVCLTEDQVEEYNLPTAPPKLSDSRSATWVGDTCQLEAMAPDDLVALVTAKVEDLYDMDAYQENLDREEEERDNLREEWKSLMEKRHEDG